MWATPAHLQKCVSVPVIFVRRRAQEKIAKETGSKNGREQQQSRDRRQQLARRGMAQNRGPHSFQRIRDRNQPRHALQPHRQHGNRIHHSSHHGGKAEDRPIHRIAALEDQQIARAQDSQSRKRQNRRRQHQQCAQPVGSRARENRTRPRPSRCKSPCAATSGRTDTGSIRPGSRGGKFASPADFRACRFAALPAGFRQMCGARRSSSRRMRFPPGRKKNSSIRAAATSQAQDFRQTGKENKSWRTRTAPGKFQSKTPRDSCARPRNPGETGAPIFGASRQIAASRFIALPVPPDESVFPGTPPAYRRRPRP